MIDAIDGTLIGTPTILEGRGRGALYVVPTDQSRFYQVTVTDFGTHLEPATTSIATISAIDGSVIGVAETRGIDGASSP